ncbi:MAG TPA: hypothetical protein VNA29_00160 [Sphingomicrobium sp.]|nr:hypothetical protein [Sphingomicrobium sp.]
MRSLRDLDRSTLISLILAGLILLLIFGVWVSQRGDGEQDKLTEDQIAEATGTLDEAEKRCGSQRTYDLIKRELFRRAAEMRGSDKSAFDRLTAASSVRMEAPAMTARNAELGTISCSGHLSLDLPPGIAVVGGRRTLQADINYRLQPAADRSGDILILEGADAILLPLATLAQIAPPEGSPDSILSPEVPNDPAPAPQIEAVPPPAPSAVARPSYDCSNARTRGEVAVCEDPGLAALDRQMAAQYQRAVAATDPQRRQWLRSTRDSFLRYRDRCGSSACIAEAYRGRMREIDDIVSGRWRPGG